MIEVGHAEGLGLVDEDRIRARDVNAALDDRGGKEDVVLTALERTHLECERARVHLAVGDNDARRSCDPSKDALQPFLHASDVCDAVVKEEHLSSSCELVLDCGTNHLVRIAGDACFDSDSLAWRRAEKGEISRTRH